MPLTHAHSASYNSMLGTSVTVAGIARNARMGAIVQTADRTPIYIDGLEEWDDELDGESVSATGMLRRKKLAPDPVVGPDGAVSHGMEGTCLVLENATWSVSGS